MAVLSIGFVFKAFVLFCFPWSKQKKKMLKIQLLKYTKDQKTRLWLYCHCISCTFVCFLRYMFIWHPLITCSIRLIIFLVLLIYQHLWLPSLKGDSPISLRNTQKQKEVHLQVNLYLQTNQEANIPQALNQSLQTGPGRATHVPQPIRNAQTGQFETVYSVVCLPSDQTSCIPCGYPFPWKI